ncbi:T3SS effector HopA1 family protein [Dickeya fangzhongdai]|uniref:T3SS effector HopA1 family protein n=1 Tax=Dickeya fangzhongdai TaxID=1778540 RepID=UPI0023E3D0A0|nr:T3SS effector HopA1 family protein [Dickeya fangzhongdai]WES90240.1 T3SS effector HopA1 family protein [Dickeya fangzhongdai]
MATKAKVFFSAVENMMGSSGESKARLDGTGGVGVFPQHTGPIGKDLMKGYLQNNPQAAHDFIMFRRNDTSDAEPSSSRITLSVHPKNAAKLPEILHALIRDKDYLHTAKNRASLLFWAGYRQRHSLSEWSSW